ncbi:phosphatase PAP2 family protein [Glutamicibacter sp. HZAU]|uniref:phosphatase PAP2 family protein n=1 Tax=Glutamicibacter sp. HZAU TaxID=2049891 RepID=UPI0013763DF8|nr:phosphatase PAP2 family protein [Glutamicibacter sp. HZAU]
MRSSWYFRHGQRPGGAQVLWIIFGLVVAMFYFTRRVLVSLHAGGWAKDLDAPAYQLALEHQSPFLFAVSDFLYFWGSTPGMTMIMLVITGLLCWKTRSAWPLAAVAFTALVSVLLTVILKANLQVPRPQGIPGGPAPPETFSFPSGHTLNSAALIGIASYLAIIYGLRRYAYLIAIIAALFVLAMGASRIYIGHHWVSDVLVGLLIGAAWAAVVAILHYFFVPRPAASRPARGSARR